MASTVSSFLHVTSQAESVLGSAAGPQTTLSDGATTRQVYQRGAVFSNPAYGTFIIPLAVNTKFDQCASLTTASKENVQSYLGAPVQDPVSLSGGVVVVYFERGMITVRSNQQAFVTYGDIYLRYRNFNGVNGVLGLPVSDEEAVGTGRRSRFDAGEICSKSGVGTFEVHGAIHDRYEALGGPAVFGFPITNESSVMRNGQEVGRYNNFQNGGSIYWSASTGAWDVYGAIKVQWDAMGGPNGSLGFPKSGETDTPQAHSPGNDANGRYNNFQNGIIVWHPAGPYTGALAVLNLHFYVDSFVSSFDSIHVQAKVSTTYGQSYDNWIPSDSDYTSNPRVQKDLLPVIPAVHSDLSISVWFDGLGHHTLGSDERLGIYQSTYNISNLWGLFEAPDHSPNQNQNSSYSFDCKFRTSTDIPVAAGTPWRKDFWWPFHNFSTPSLSWSQYAQTFTDVHDQESVVWHPFDHLFYSIAYEGVASNGNCYGMVLESIYAQNHRSIYNEPLFSDPYNGFSASLLAGGTPGAGDATVTNDINIKHGYQIGAEGINYFLGKFLSGKTHDPVKCFQESLASWQAGDPPLISMSKDYFFNGGHCVRPYEWNNQSKPWTIKIANPNTPASTFPDDNAATNVIKIDPDANTFTVNEGVETTYSGGSSSGGRLYSMPYSVFSSPPCTPFWDVLALLASGAVIILGGDAATKQITDQSSNTYLSSDGTVNENPLTRIPGLAPIPRVHGGPHSPLTSLKNVSEVAKASETAKTIHDVVNPVREIPTPSDFEMYYLQNEPALAVTSIFPSSTAASSPSPSGVLHDVNTLKDRAVSVTEKNLSLTLDAKAPLASTLSDLNQNVARRFASPSLTHVISSANGGSYQWGMRTAAMSVVVQSQGASANSPDQMLIANPGRTGQSFSISSGSGAAAKTASVQIVGPVIAGAATAKLFEISNLPVTSAQGVTLSLDNGGQELMIHNPGPQVSVALRVQSGTVAANSVVRSAVTLEANAFHSISPSDWTPAKIATTPVTMKILDKPGGAVLRTMTI